MKTCLFLTVLVAALTWSAGGISQTSKKTPARATESPVQTKNELLGKWSIDHIAIHMVMPSGEEMTDSFAGENSDYFDFGNEKIFSHIKNDTDVTPYSIEGNNIIIIDEGQADTMHIVSLTKTTCVLHKNENSEAGKGEITISMKR